MNLDFMQELANRRSQMADFAEQQALPNDSATMQLANGLQVNTDAIPNLPPLQQGELAPELKPHQRNDGPQTLGATVANEIIRRLEGSEKGAEQQGEGGEQPPKDSTDLRYALGQTMDWIRDRFGDEAAAAASGMVLSATANEVNEDTLGDGLLNALKFIDRNFGIAAGDSAIAQFNQTVNVELNNYFENGKTELFMAETTPVSDQSATQDINTRFFMRAAQASTPFKDTDELTATQKLLDSLKQELDKTAELQNLTTQLEAEFNPTLASPQAAINAYANQSTPAEPRLANFAV